MTYLKINDTDYSLYCNQLKISVKAIFKSATNAAGNTVVKFINRKRTITVGIIPLNETVMAALQNDIQQFKVSVSYRDPKTNELVENVQCIIPNDDCEFYTIQADNVLYKATTIVLQEL
jgi:hypothetical protein